MTCAAVLRYENVGLLLVSQQRVLDMLIGMIDGACLYYGTPDVSSSHLAEYVEPRLKRVIPWRDVERSRAGMKAHEDLFR